MNPYHLIIAVLMVLLTASAFFPRRVVRVGGRVTRVQMFVEAGLGVTIVGAMLVIVLAVLAALVRWMFAGGFYGGH